MRMYIFLHCFCFCFSFVEFYIVHNGTNRHWHPSRTTQTARKSTSLGYQHRAQHATPIVAQNSENVFEMAEMLTENMRGVELIETSSENTLDSDDSDATEEFIHDASEINSQPLIDPDEFDFHSLQSYGSIENEINNGDMQVGSIATIENGVQVDADEVVNAPENEAGNEVQLNGAEVVEAAEIDDQANGVAPVVGEAGNEVQLNDAAVVEAAEIADQVNEVEAVRTVEIGIQVDGSILQCPRMMQTLTYQYATFLRSYRIMRHTLVGYEPMQMGHHVRMMSAIDLHFLDINRTTNIDPALIRYVESCQRDMVNFGTVDQMRMHFISLEAHRISLELNARHTFDRQLIDQQIACLLCGKHMGLAELFTSGVCGHVYCDTCFSGITTRGMNTLCAFDRLNLSVEANHFKLKVEVNDAGRIICAMCEIPFNSFDGDSIFAIRPCGHMFHGRCVTSQIFQCCHCAQPIFGRDMKLFVAFA